MQKRYCADVIMNEFWHEGKLYKDLPMSLFKRELPEEDIKALPEVDKDYNSFSQEEKVWAQMQASHYFTHEQLLEIEPYFKNLGKLKVRWADFLPTDTRFNQMVDEQHDMFHHMFFEDKGYSLKLKIGGHYELGHYYYDVSDIPNFE